MKNIKRLKTRGKKRARSAVYRKEDWAELFVIFIFLAAAVIVLGAVGALLMDLIMRLST
jgi:hypothetical protein